MKLRPLRITDAPLMLEWMHDDNIVHDLHRDFSKLTIEDCERFIQKSLDDDTRDLHLAITSDLTTDPDEYLGTVSLKHIDNASHTSEFGITIRKSAMGTGVALDAMRAIFEIAHSRFDIQRIYWCVSPDNTRALRFYDKNGYTRILLSDNPEIHDVISTHGDYQPEDIDRYVWYLAHTSV